MDSQSNLYLLADGMGGHAAGAVASDITVNTINDFVSLANESREMTWPFGYNIQVAFEHNVLQTATMLANLKVSQASEEMEKYAGMGSTLVALWIRGDTAFYCHIGDSRLYLLRGKELDQLTEDHTLVQEQLKKGIIQPEQLKDHTLRHIVTRAIGIRERLQVEVQEKKLESNDQLLVCCDGLSDKVEHEKIRDILLAGRDLNSTCKELIDAANLAGGEDNITAILLQYVS